MTSEAQLAANFANSRKATGPKSAAGRARSAMNALKHGLRSKKVALLRDDTYAFETRKQKWMAEYEPETDAQEYLLHANVVLSFELDRARNAGFERRANLIENSDEADIEEARVLGKLLFFTRSDSEPTPRNGSHRRQARAVKHKSSFSEMPIESEDTVKLLKTMESTAAGCFWLFERWEELRARLVPGKHWRPSDTFKALRLLGADPADASLDRRIAEILLACHCVSIGGVNAEPTEVQNHDALADPGSDAYLGLFEGILEKVRKEWPDLVRLTENEARRILIDLADENVERLAAKLEEFAEDVDALALKSTTQLSFDQSPQGERLRSYFLKFKNSLERGLKNLEKSKAKRDAGGWNERPGARRNVDISWAHEAGRALDRGAKPVHDEPVGNRAGASAGKDQADAAVTGDDRRGETCENETNEANFAENAVSLQDSVALDVTTKISVNPGLDKGGEPGAREPAAERVSIESDERKSLSGRGDRAGPEGVLVRDNAVRARTLERPEGRRPLALEEQIRGEIPAAAANIAEIVRRSLPRAP
jgi:hypothetical protein